MIGSLLTLFGLESEEYHSLGLPDITLKNLKAYILYQRSKGDKVQE